jgi:drug/metabolite transporter (DMT)-like permease
MLIGWLAFGVRPGGREWLGFAVSFVGVAAILSHGDWHRLLALELNTGDLLVLVAMVAWSTYTLLLSRRPLELSAFAYVFVAGAFGLAGLAPIYAWELATGRGAFTVTPEVVAGIAYCAILASIVTTATLNYGVARVVLHPSRAGIWRRARGDAARRAARLVSPGRLRVHPRRYRRFERRARRIEQGPAARLDFIP